MGHWEHGETTPGRWPILEQYILRSGLEIHHHQSWGWGRWLGKYKDWSLSPQHPARRGGLPVIPVLSEEAEVRSPGQAG